MDSDEDKLLLLVVALLISGRFEPEQVTAIAVRVAADIEEACDG